MCTCGDEQDLCCLLLENFTDDKTLLDSDKQNVCSPNIDEQLLVENFESSWITVTPSTLTFPYNNPKNHTQRLTIWNRTINALKIRVKSPDPDVFTVYLDGKGSRAKPGFLNQIMLYGLAARTISIKCTPGRYKIARVPLQIFAYTYRDNTCECVQVPLEIYPSTAWFNLPTTIIIPEVVIGRKAHALIILPQPRVSERFFVTFHPTHTQNAITLLPMHGTIGGDDGIKQLRVTYAPTEYTTVACSIKVHFPGLSATTAHEIKILARCRPGNEADLIRKEIAEIESFRPKPVKRKRKHPKMRLKSLFNSQDKGHQDGREPRKPPLSLFTIAGVVRFLLSKGNLESSYMDSEDHRRKTAVELLALQIDLDTEEKVKIYNSIKTRLGLDFEDENNTGRSKLKSNQRRDWEEFQKAVGMVLMGKLEELPPEEIVHVPHHETPRKSKHYGKGGRDSFGSSGKNSSRKASLKGSMKKHVRESVSEDERRMYKSIMADVQLDLTPKQKFVQLVLKIITRGRADKRISKVKFLVEEIRKATRRRSSKGSAVKSIMSGKQSNEGSLKQRSGFGSKVAVFGSERKSALQSQNRISGDPIDPQELSEK